MALSIIVSQVVVRGYSFAIIYVNDVFKYHFAEAIETKGAFVVITER